VVKVFAVGMSQCAIPKQVGTYQVGICGLVRGDMGVVSIENDSSVLGARYVCGGRVKLTGREGSSTYLGRYVLK